jgi:YebC/PmpR family DNA-binding regulatory protein
LDEIFKNMGRAFEYRRAAKEARWDKMSKVFPKLAKAITVAAREGGTDPEMNAKLRTAIQNAKAENMPKDNIENAIKRAAGKDASEISEITFEGKGPHGVLVFVECATDNNNRTVANIKAYFSKAGGSLVPSGSLEFMFSRKAVFEFAKTDGIELEELELEMIDAGLESLEENNEMVYAYGDYTNFGTMGTFLEEKGLPVKKASLKRFANAPITLSETEMDEVEKLLDKLEDDDDVQAVFTNID